MRKSTRLLLTMSGGAVVPSYLGQVATRCGFFPSDIATGNKQLMARTNHRARVAITSLRVRFPNFYVQTDNGGGVGSGNYLETAPGAAATISATIEYPSGTYTRVKFSGSNDGTIPDGQSLLSDTVSVSIPNGAQFWVRSYYRNTAGIIFVHRRVASADSTNGDGLNFGVTTPDRTEGGAINSTVLGYHPTAIIAQTTKASVFQLGDSITLGAFDVADDTTGDVAWQRSIGPTLAYINGGVYGDKASIAKSNYTQRKAAAVDYCSHVLIAMGRNDITAGDLTTPVLANLQALADLFPDKEVIRGTITPRSSSTDSWATVGNQTTNGDNVTTVAVNAALRAMTHIDFSDAVSSARDSGLFKAGYSQDGTHLKQAGYMGVKALNVPDPAVFVYP